VDNCRKAGITVPIIPGLKVLKSARQLASLPRNFHVNIPDALVDEINENPKHVKTIGVEWSVKQCEELFNKGAPCIHFFVLEDVKTVLKVVKQF
jgi:methylenetetrahydrofolate reductase (NADPH)